MAAINWSTETPYLLAMIFNDSPACTVWDDAEPACGEVFDVFCASLPPTEITWPGNTKLLSNWLFCLILSTEVLYFWAILHNDSPDCTVCCVEACASWCVKNAAAPDVAVIANANFFKGTPP